MTASTEQQRAEALANEVERMHWQFTEDMLGLFGEPPAFDEMSGEYIDRVHQLAWLAYNYGAEQAARRAQVVPDSLTSEMSDAGLNAYNQCTSPFRRSKLAAAFYAMLAAAPQPPEAGCSVSNAETEAAPVQMPEPAAWTMQRELDEKRTTTNGHLWFSNPVNSSWTALYTEQQVRALLAKVAP